jgi:hypothetical protein
VATTFCTGFEHQTAVGGGNTFPFNSVNGTAPTFDNTRVHLPLTGAAFSARWSLGSSTSGNLTLEATTRTANVLGFALMITSYAASGNLIICNLPNANGNLQLRIGTAGVVVPVVGTTTGSGGPTLSLNRWYWFDVYADTSTGTATLRYRVDGVEYLATTNAQTSIGMTTVQLGQFSATAGASAFNIDDVIIGDAATDFPFGEGACIGLVPTGVGTHSVGADGFRWTSNNGTGFTGIGNSGDTTSYQALDEWPVTADGNAGDDWVEKSAGTTQANYVEYTLGDTLAGGSPLAVRAIVAIRNDALTVGNNLQATLLDGATEGDIFNATIGSATVIYKAKHFNTPPAGGVWTVEKLNALRLRFHSTDPAPVPRLKAMIMEAWVPNPRTPAVVVRQAVARAATR